MSSPPSPPLKPKILLAEDNPGVRKGQKTLPKSKHDRSRFKAVLFDLDGTLLDTLADLADSMNAVLASFQYPSHPRESYKYFVGDGVEALAKRVLPPNQVSPEKIKVCVERMLSEYKRRWAAKTSLYPGVPALLTGLRAKGLNLAILSNKPHEFTLKTVEHFLGQWHFACIRGASSELAKKPDPGGALAIADALRTAPEDFLYLGDTDTDMKTAGAAGMHAVGVLWGFRSAEELRLSGAKILLAHPPELLDYL